MTQMSMNKVIHGAVRRDLDRFVGALSGFPTGDQKRANELQTYFSKAGLEVAHLELGLFTDRLGTAWLSRTPLPAL